MNDAVNFLVSCAGRRGELVKILQQVVELHGRGGGVFATDRSDLTAAGWLADGLDLVPDIADPNYIEALLDVCARRNITDLIPTIDTDLPILAAHRDRFLDRGTRVWVSSPEAIAIAQDKCLTNAWLRESGIPCIRQWRLRDAATADLDFPLVAKPARGSSSIGLRVVHDRAELALLDASLDYVLEEVAPGVEYTVDVLVDRDGICRGAVPRRRLETRAGEVSKGCTVRNPRLIQAASAAAEALPGAFGVLNVQMFLDDDDGLNVIEVNARFGGGFPLTWRAGAQFPLWLVQHLNGEVSNASLDWLEDQVMLRYDAAVLLDRRR